MISEVSKRYAKALYELANSSKTNERVFSELQILGKILVQDDYISDFIQSPLVSPEQKIQALKSALSGKMSEDVVNTLHLLAEKNRLYLLSEIVGAFEIISDHEKGVTRGTVRSAASLNADEKQRIENTVTNVTKKKVILNFEEDKNLLGGMIAQVGGWTFDDSLESHLTSLSEDLKRRTH